MLKKRRNAIKRKKWAVINLKTDKRILCFTLWDTKTTVWDIYFTVWDINTAL